jgi:hypothetical protein
MHPDQHLAGPGLRRRYLLDPHHPGWTEFTNDDRFQGNLLCSRR